MTAAEVKQIIVIRKDLKMRRGKEIAQGAHGSIAWLTRRLSLEASAPDGEGIYTAQLTAPEKAWIEGAFTKICVVVHSVEELLELQEKCKEAGVACHLITDKGLTEFGGIPTETVLAIGPDYSDRLDPITSDLKLY